MLPKISDFRHIFWTQYEILSHQLINYLPKINQLQSISEPDDLPQVNRVLPPSGSRQVSISIQGSFRSRLQYIFLMLFYLDVVNLDNISSI